MANEAVTVTLSNDEARMLLSFLPAYAEETRIKMVDDPTIATYPDLTHMTLNMMERIAYRLKVALDR